MNKVSNNYFRVGVIGLILILVLVFIYTRSLSVDKKEKDLSDRVDEINSQLECEALAGNFEREFENSGIKERLKYNDPIFKEPIILFNEASDICFLKTGYEYADHGGRSQDLFLFDVKSKTPLLKASDAVRYINEAGAYYQDPIKENILTIEEFNLRAKAMMGFGENK